ncbi:hypothetical protein Vadar_029412 [Vaccinium darrowii]|uniref:Uncharacterized protein n=1 Tax=Vaccinium darrowii TaxID=229202 RepID=A0ACB7Y3C5_9ERIC|nr:hypothetical protein Vadar_029412 [Vaccinium darrowii]
MDPEFIEAASKDEFDIRLSFQPPNSPDLNVLDLGVFRAIQSLQYQQALKTIDELVSAVKKSFEELSLESLNHVFLTFQACMVEVMKVYGGINYKVPHMGKNRLERNGNLPIHIQCQFQNGGRLVFEKCCNWKELFLKYGVVGFEAWTNLMKLLSIGGGSPRAWVQKFTPGQTHHKIRTRPSRGSQGGPNSMGLKSHLHLGLQASPPHVAKQSPEPKQSSREICYFHGDVDIAGFCLRSLEVTDIRGVQLPEGLIAKAVAIDTGADLALTSRARWVKPYIYF